MLIAMIAAMAQNRCIGRHGQLPWHLPEDLQRFKRITMGQTLLMGRKTWQSIGRPLPGRESIVLSRDPDFKVEGAQLVASLQDGIGLCRTEQLFICGGAEIFRQALPLVDKVYLTELLRDVEGDTFLPPLPERFRLIHSEELVDAGEPCRFSVLAAVS